MNTPTYTLPGLGWSQFYQSQMSLEDCETLTPVRIIEVHRNAVDTLGTSGAIRVAMNDELHDTGVAVGDWILIDPETHKPTQVFDRKAIIKRRSAQDRPSAQLIAANVDTLFIVSSCNADYNTARLERYLALARQAEIYPVIVLTKSDLIDDPDTYVERAQADLPGVDIVTLDATSPDPVSRLSRWCGVGQTVALIGSSGVGKTTLTNTLTGRQELTLEIREDDAKGRHTTTRRSMYAIPAGGWLIDTPGMRSLPLYDVSDGIDMVFEDVAELAQHCKFNDCQHDSEPGCAIQAAIAEGITTADRLFRWQKLAREDQFNTETIAERHSRVRETSKKYKVGKAKGLGKRDGYGQR